MRMNTNALCTFMKFFGNFDSTEQDLMRFTADNEREISFISIKDNLISVTFHECS